MENLYKNVKKKNDLIISSCPELTKAEYNYKQMKALYYHHKLAGKSENLIIGAQRIHKTQLFTIAVKNKTN